MHLGEIYHIKGISLVVHRICSLNRGTLVPGPRPTSIDTRRCSLAQGLATRCC